MTIYVNNKVDFCMQTLKRYICSVFQLFCSLDVWIGIAIHHHEVLDLYLLQQSTQKQDEIGFEIHPWLISDRTLQSFRNKDMYFIENITKNFLTMHYTVVKKTIKKSFYSYTTRLLERLFFLLQHDSFCHLIILD